MTRDTALGFDGDAERYCGIGWDVDATFSDGICRPSPSSVRLKMFRREFEWEVGNSMPAPQMATTPLLKRHCTAVTLSPALASISALLAVSAPTKSFDPSWGI